ncbi:MAG: alanine racemase [Verrucomicrobiota bacterium]|jgi:alanine racemase
MNESTESANTLRCWVEVELNALRHNAAAILARTSAGLMAVVKANGYGHGTVHVVRAIGESVAMFGVANLKEAREVRSVCPERPVFILGPALPCEREAIVREGFIPAVSGAAEAAGYAAHGAVTLHLAIDTGMGRMGVWKDDALSTARELLVTPNVRLEGVCSHLSCADSDAALTAQQLADFRLLATEITSLAGRQLCLHVENSAATLAFPADAGDIVRCGLALYGIPPVPGFQQDFRPALSWKTRVVLVREMNAGRGVSYGRTFVTSRRTTVATLAVGYADGYPRELSGKGAEVVIAGKRCPVIGRVTMDQIMVDVTGIGPVAAGDDAELIGPEIPATELAEKAGTIPWDILTGIGQRVTRIAV